jgi:hypothetical protein
MAHWYSVRSAGIKVNVVNSHRHLADHAQLRSSCNQQRIIHAIGHK